MGITGLLPFLDQVTKPCHIAEFRGATCVIDAYCWLHKGANACAERLAQGEDSQVYVQYCLRYIKMLQSYDIRPILVFDGKNLPAKAETEAKRRESRAKAKQRAAELLRMGKTDEARTYLKQCVNITPDMASAVIKECHKINVDCIVAPYESDAQLAFFNLKGIAEVVITEDSDLLLFGCSKVLFKLDMQGRGYLVEACKIPEAMQLRPDRYTFDKFRYMCILSGCDYIESLRGIGLKKAQKFITLTEETNPQIFLDKLPRYLNMRHLQITDEYKENFMLADGTFRHQTVFDPFKKKLVPLTNPEVCGTNPKYCKNAGEVFDHDTAYQVALGNLHPTTFKPLDNWSPNQMVSSTTSIWSGSYERSVSRKEQKAKFREYFKCETKTQINETLIDEQEKFEQDLVIAKELQFYYCKKTETRKTTVTDVKEEKEVEECLISEPTSPVLKKNPFLKKRLNNFHLTDTNSKTVVKSRYFSLEKMKETVETTEESSEEVRESESSDLDVENRPPSGNDEIKFDPSSPGENESGDSDTTKKLTDEVVDLSISDCDEDDDDAEVVKVEEPKKIEFSSQERKGDSGSMKRKKIGPCRSVGLKRNKSAGQQSIQHFFERMKKD